MNIVGEIKWYLDNDYAQLKFSESRTGFSIDTVMVPVAHRGKGIGTGLIQHVLTLADATAKKVRVNAYPIGNITEEKLQQLITYYMRFGFYIEDRGFANVYMVRNQQGLADKSAAND